MARLARIVWAANLLLIAGLVALYFAGVGTLGSDTPMGRLFSVLLYLLFACTGGLITTRPIGRSRPANPIGWIFSGVVFLYMISGYAEDYALYSLVLRPGALPGGIWAAWLFHWLENVAFGVMLTFTFLLFPDGRFISPRWRWLARLTALLIAVQALAVMLNPGPLSSGFQGFSNPLGISAAAPLLNRLVDFLPNLGGAAILLSAASLLVRYRRSQGIERVQIQWIALGAALPIAGLFLFALIVFVLANSSLGNSSSLLDQVFNLFFALAVIAFPVTTAIAILRYRLYNIEVIVRRTLIYAALTASLSLVYFGSVVMLQQAFRLITGGGSPAAVVLSTLAIAALFTPLRARIQALIDRRFYRRRYSSDQILHNFSARLRSEVDLEQINHHLIATVDDAVQPEGVTLWIRQNR